MTETEKIEATIVGHTENSPELGLPTGQGSSQAAKPTPSVGATGGATAE
jgi:hypothetical protein